MRSILFSILIITLFACNKTPVANFKMEEEISFGKEVKITNTSSNASSYLWELPNGETRDTKDIVYKPSTSGTKKIKLTAYSKNEKKQNSISKSIKVIPEFGSVIFYLSDKAPLERTTVYFLETEKDIPVKLSSAPDCENSTGAALFKDVTNGNYNYLAGDNSNSWSGTV
ncbi:MAG: hypothetical protein M3Q58_04990, partial [Bacteroidota bacterium]|nr:hypothetical protein [Bacteroidota bacterium]